MIYRTEAEGFDTTYELSKFERSNLDIIDTVQLDHIPERNEEQHHRWQNTTTKQELRDWRIGEIESAMMFDVYHMQWYENIGSKYYRALGQLAESDTTIIPHMQYLAQESGGSSLIASAGLSHNNGNLDRPGLKRIVFAGLFVHQLRIVAQANDNIFRAAKQLQEHKAYLRRCDSMVFDSTLHFSYSGEAFANFLYADDSLRRIESFEQTPDGLIKQRFILLDKDLVFVEIDTLPFLKDSTAVSQANVPQLYQGETRPCRLYFDNGICYSFSSNSSTQLTFEQQKISGEIVHSKLEKLLTALSESFSSYCPT